jgi:membrane protease YdiL (CAAX protease family)
MIPKFNDQKESFLKNIFAALGFFIVWIVALDLLWSFIPQYNIFGELATKDHFVIHKEYLEVFVKSCIFAPIWEEAVFRMLPFQILKKFNLVDSLGIYIAVASSAIFGYIHGDSFNVFAQGVIGLGFCWLYVRSNYSYKSIVIAHSVFNFLVIFALKYLYS